MSISDGTFILMSKTDEPYGQYFSGKRGPIFLKDEWHLRNGCRGGNALLQTSQGQHNRSQSLSLMRLAHQLLRRLDVVNDYSAVKRLQSKFFD